MNTLHNIDTIKALAATLTSCLTKLNTAQNRISFVADGKDALKGEITQAIEVGDFDKVAELSAALKRKKVTDCMQDAITTARHDYVRAADDLAYALQSTYNLADVADAEQAAKADEITAAAEAA